MQPREHWSSRASFVMAAVGSAVGLGNLWRFPAVCAGNGGGAFLLPYFIALVTVGIPLLILEMSLGHRMQRSAPQAIGQVRPTFEWLGWWSALGGFIIACFYSVVIAWCLAFLVHSFIPESMTQWAAGGEAAETFFTKTILRQSDTPLGSSPGQLVWPIVGYLAVTWLLIFVLILKGVKQVGKVVLITVPLPIVLIIVLFFRGITLPGALDGIRYYLQPNWEVLKSPEVWRAAYGQIFFSLSVGFGVMVAYASYLDRKTDITNNAFMTGLINCGFSFFAGFAVFSVLGFMARDLSDPSVLQTGGGGLAFIVYPTALARLPLPQLFAVMFFLTLLTLGIDSAFSIVEAIVAAVMEKFDMGRTLALAIVCVLGFGGGLIYCTQNGDPYLTATNKYIDFGIIAVSLGLCITVGWFYGAERMREYINSVSEIKIGRWWDVLIAAVAPAILVVILAWSIFDVVTTEYVGEQVHQGRMELMLGALPLVATVVIATLLMVLRAERRGRAVAAAVKVWIWLAILVAAAYFYPRHPEVVMGGFGCLFLYGGLAWCILRARKARQEAHQRELAAEARHAAEAATLPADGQSPYEQP